MAVPTSVGMFFPLSDDGRVTGGVGVAGLLIQFDNLSAILPG